MSRPTSTTSSSAEWLRLSLAAELLGLSACTLRRWSDQGRVPCHRTGGGQRRFRREDLERLLNDSALPHGSTGAGASADSDHAPARVRTSRRSRDAAEGSDGRDQILLELLGLAGTITQPSDLHQFAQTVAARVRGLLGVCECDVFVTEGAGLRYLASADADGFDESMVDRRITLTDYPLSAAAMARRETLVVASPADPRLSDYERSELTDYGLASELWIPLCSGERLVGAIDIFDDKPRDYGEIVGVAAKVGQMVAGALQAGLLLTQEEERATALREALALGELAARTKDVDALLVDVAERLLVATDAADCDIFRVTGEGEMSCLVSVDRNGRDETVSGELLALADYPTCAHAVDTGEIVVIPDPADPRLTELDLEAYAEFGFQSEVVCPLISDGQTVGLIEIYDDHPRDFAAVLDLLKHAKQTIGIAYERAGLVQHLDQANRDLALVNATSMALATSLELDAVLLETADRLSQAVDAPCCEIFLRTSLDEISCSLSVTDGAVDTAWTGKSFSLDDLAVTREAIDSRTPIAVTTFADPRVTEAGRRYRSERGHASALIVPLAVASQVLGAAVLAETRCEREFSPDETAMAASICQVAALAIRNAQLHEREREQTEHLSALFASSRAIASTSDLEGILTTVAQAAVDTLRAEDCVIFAYDDGAETLTNVTTCQTAPGVFELQGQTRPVDEYPLGRALLAMDDVLEEHLSDPDLDPQSRASMDQWGELSCLTVPLRYGGRSMGLLVVTESAHERHFSPAEVDMARALGEQAAAALHNHATLRFEIEQNARLESLLESSRAMAASGELEDALSVIARVTAEALGVPECMVFEFDAAADVIIPRANFEVSPSEWDELGVPFPLAEHPAERIMLRDGSILEERLSDPDLDPASRRTMEAWGEKTCLSVPVSFGEAYKGLIVLYENDRERHFSEGEVALVRGLGEQAAAAIHSAQTLRGLEQRNRRLASLAAAGEAMSTETALDVALPEMARQACESLGASWCLISEHAEETDSIVERAYYGSDPDEGYELKSWALDEDGWGTRSLLTNAVIVEEQLSDPGVSRAVRDSMERLGEKTCLTVPLVFSDEPVGTLVLCETREERHFTDDERQYAGALGRQAAAAIHGARQLARLEERNKVLADLLDAGRATTSTLMLDEVLRVLARKAAEAMGSPSCLLWEYDAETDSLIERECYDVTGEYQAGGDAEALSEHPEQALALFAEGPLVETISDPQIPRVSRASMEKWGEKTCLSLPLVFGEERLGIIVFSETESERVYAPAELELAAGLADLAAIAIHNARSYQDLENQNVELAARARRERFVSESSTALSSSLDLEQVLVAAAHRFTDLLDVGACDIYEIDDDEFVCVASVVDGETYPEWIGTRMKVDDYSADRLCVETRRAVAISSVDDPRLSETERAGMQEWGEKSILILPLVAKDRVVGSVQLVEKRSEREFTGDDLAAAEAICRMAGLAIDNARQYARLHSLNRETSERAARETLVNEISLELASTLDPHDILTTTALRMADSLDMTGCDIYRLEENEYICVASVLDGDLCPEWIGGRVDVRDSATGALVAETRSTVVISSTDDHRLSETERQLLLEWGEKSLLILPMVAGGRLVGTIELTETRSEREFTPEAITTAEAVARMAALFVVNADLFVRQAEHARRLGSLLEAGRSIGSSLVAGDVLETIAEKAAEALGTSECIIFEYDAAADTLTAKALHQETATPYEDLGKPFPLSESPADRAILAGREIVVESLSDPDLDPASRASMEEWGEKTCLNVPLVFGGQPLGILVAIETAQERSFTQDDLEIATGLSAQAAIALHNARVFERLKLRTFETEVLNDIAREASSSLSVPDIAEAAIEQARRLLPIDEGALLLMSGDSLETVYTTGEGRRLVHDPADGVHADLLSGLRGNPVAIVGWPDGSQPAPDGGRCPALCSTAYTGLGAGDALQGVLVLSTSQDGGYSDADRRVLEGIGAHLALAVKNARLFDDVKQLQLGNLKSLSSALLAKDHYTVGHTARVAAYAVLLAGELGWPDPAMEEVEEVALLHDIGKIAVSDRVLLKTGQLTDEEWDLMRKHPVISAEIIEPLLDAELVAGVRHHHERFDGRGYPNGLAGEEIPELARLLAVVDAYDAMSSRRVYKSPLPYAACLAELERCRGTQFDPHMVDAFKKVLQHLEAQRRIAVDAATEAASRIDPAKHGMLLEPADTARAEYREIVAMLAELTAKYPQVYCFTTGVKVDDQRTMFVIDTDEDPEVRATIGETSFADDEELEMYRGRTVDVNVLGVDAWGAYVSGCVPLRDAFGSVVATVSANIVATSTGGMALPRTSVYQSFTDLPSVTTHGLTRMEVDAMTDPLTGLYNHQHLQRTLALECAAATEGGRELSLLFCDIDCFRQFNDGFGHAAGDNVLKGIAAVIGNCVRRVDVAARYAGDMFAVVLSEAGAAEALEIAERIRTGVQSAHLSPRPEGLTVSVGVAVISADAETRQDLIDGADAALHRAKCSGGNRCVSFSPAMVTAQSDLPVEPADLRYLGAMAELADAKTRYERRHSEAVKRLAVALARELGLPPDDAGHIGEAAKLRDIGLVAVPDEILGKPTALTENDWLMVHQHCLTGQSLLRESGVAEAIAEAIVGHHESYDGSGYPAGLKGEQIPLTARIVAVASAFQAMVVSRPYREALSQEDALAEMGRCAGSQFDPAVVDGLRRVTAADAMLTCVSRGAAPRTGPPGRV